MFHDPDADAELLDFGGSASSPGRARVPQVKYTYQGPYGTVWVVGMENPEPEAIIPAGKISVDTTSIQIGPMLGDRQHRGQPSGDHGLRPERHVS